MSREEVEIISEKLIENIKLLDRMGFSKILLMIDNMINYYNNLKRELSEKSY